MESEEGKANDRCNIFPEFTCLMEKLLSPQFSPIGVEAISWFINNMQ